MYLSLNSRMMKKYILHFAFFLSFFSFLPKTSFAALEIEYLGGWPSKDFTMLKGSQQAYFAFNLFNNSNQTISSPLEIKLNFFVEKELKDSFNETISEDINQFSSIFNQQGEQIIFRLTREETLELPDNANQGCKNNK